MPHADTLVAAVLQELLSRRYYEVFYPHAGTDLTKPEVNMWLTQCGTGKPNAADDATGSVAGRKLLQRSDKIW